METYLVVCECCQLTVSTVRHFRKERKLTVVGVVGVVVVVGGVDREKEGRRRRVAIVVQHSLACGAKHLLAHNLRTTPLTHKNILDF